MDNNQNNEKLESKDLGKLKNNSKKSPVGVIIFMMILLLTVIFLPNITDYLDELKKATPNNEIKPSDKDKDDKDNSEELVYYELSTNPVISFNNLVFSNVKLNYNTDYNLTLDIENKNSNLINFNDSKYYLELYNSDKTLLERVKVIGKELLTNGQGSYILEINNASYTSSKTFLVREIAIANYPIIEIKDNILTCINGESKITYTFNEDKLTGIEHIYNYTNSNLEEYSRVLNAYKERNQSFNNISGITSSVVAKDNNFVYNTSIDLIIATAFKSNYPVYFSQNTPSKVVNFELEAMRYNCQ